MCYKAHVSAVTATAECLHLTRTRLPNLTSTTFARRAAWFGLLVGPGRYSAVMQLLMYPSIDLDSTFDVLAADTWRRGMSYAREGRVLSCVWDPKLHSLFGAVDGNHGRTYTTTVRLSPADTATWNIQSGFCSCPVHLNCKHVAAIVIAAAVPTEMCAHAIPAPPAWRQSLDALLPRPRPMTGSAHHWQSS